MRTMMLLLDRRVGPRGPDAAVAADTRKGPGAQVFYCVGRSNTVFLYSFEKGTLRRTLIVTWLIEPRRVGVDRIGEALREGLEGAPPKRGLVADE